MNPADPEGAYPPQSSQSDGDARLVARMRTGDEQALAELYDKWEFTVRTAVLRIVERPMDAEDVVEEVFWQAWRHADRFDSARGGVGAWLRTIARSRALDRSRANSRSPEVALDDDDAAASSAARSTAYEAPADDALLDAERGLAVRRALLELPAEQRQALELAYYEGLSQSEIADRTGIALGTVKTRMRLALQKLRGSLSALGGSTT